MNRQTRRYFLLIFFVMMVAILLSAFFWPEWTDWKVRLGVLIVAISLSLGYRERPLQQSRSHHTNQDNLYEIERQRLKNWANSWR